MAKTYDFEETEEEARKETPNISLLMNSSFLISGYEVRDGKSKKDDKAFKWAIVHTNTGDFRTASQGLVRQLGAMDEKLKNGGQVRVKLVLDGQAFRFVAPPKLPA